MPEITRLFTGEDGQTHIEVIDLATFPDLNKMFTATGIMFRSMPPGQFMDWHPAPRRQYVITLSGEAEIGLADGTVRRFGAGHITLAEDLTGKGHTTRVVGNVPRITATIPID